MDKNTHKTRNRGSKSGPNLPATGKRKYLTPSGEELSVGDSASPPDKIPAEAKVRLQPSASRRYLENRELDEIGLESGKKSKVSETQHFSAKRLRSGGDDSMAGVAAGAAASSELPLKLSTRRLSGDSPATETEVLPSEGSVLPLEARPVDEEEAPSRAGGLSLRLLDNLRSNISAEAAVLDSEGIAEISSAVKTGRYKLLDLWAKGAESLLYRAQTGKQIFCVKAIRNRLDGWLGNSQTRRDEEKLQDVSYSTKVRHLLNEHDVARALYSEQEEMPLVRILGLRRVTKFGLELGYDLLMEYLWGYDLSQRNLLRLLTLEDKIRIMHEAVTALNYMHKRKFIHLDLKPSNFVLTHTGRIRLIDFGISVLCGYRSRSITGTAGYLSPEQIAKETLDERTDIFALGITFAILFGGRALLQSHSELLSRSVRREAKFHLESASVSAVSEVPELANMPLIAEIIRNCSILKREERISSCNYLLTLLQSAAEKYDLKLT